MCGFAGFYCSQGFPHQAESLLETMARRIAHRGPDDSGYWVDEKAGIGLAHRRLSIIDLSKAGSQPMHCCAGRYVLIFNGEIYNHRELRKMLEGMGNAPAWRGHTDTETLLACFSEWGVDKTLNSAVGMFALALWDRNEHVLSLARDRMGEKPLYWGWQAGALLFGSELKALSVHPAFRGEIDPDALELLLRKNCIPSPWTIYKGIKKLEPGHCVSFPLGGESPENIEPYPYWCIGDVIRNGLRHPFTGSDAEAVDAVENVLSLSISGQMLADVPVGAFLSGGIDSSVVVALMQASSQRPVRTFSIGFEEKGFNEAQHALAVARHLGTDHTELYVRSSDALDVIPSLPEIYCEPFADSSQIPSILVSRLASQHVTVALSGDGGDELFGGYKHYDFVPTLYSRIEKIPYGLRKVTADVLSILPSFNKVKTLEGLMYARGQEEFYSTFTSAWKKYEEVVVNACDRQKSAKDIYQEGVEGCFVSWMMAQDTRNYLSNDILEKMDRSAMANSLETRMPLLDHRVLELAWTLPLNMKIRDGKGKWVLRELLYRYVPQELVDRPKKGFSIPLAEWLRTSLREWADACLEEERLKREGFFDVKKVRKDWAEHLSGRRNNVSRLWSVLMFQAWLEEYKK